MIRQTTVKTLARTASVEGGRDGERRLKENAGAMTRETNVQNPHADRQRSGGRDEERRKPTRNGNVAQPTVPRGEEMPS